MEESPPSSPPCTTSSCLRSRLNVTLPRLRDRVLKALARSPFTISYLLLIPLIGGVLDISADHPGTISRTPSSWLILVVVLAAVCQPAGSLLLVPASRPGRLYRLNPLVCLAETLALGFRMLELRVVTGLKWVTAARVLVYEREAAVLDRAVVVGEGLLAERGDDKRCAYAGLRESLGFAPLRTRGLDASATVSILFFLLLARNCLVGATAGIQALALPYVLSFVALHSVFLVATSRDLEPEEESAVDDRLRESFLLAYAASGSPRSKPGVDDGVLRLIVVVLPCWMLGMWYAATLNGWDVISAFWIIGVVLPAVEILCFLLLWMTKVGSWQSDITHVVMAAAVWWCILVMGI